MERLLCAQCTNQPSIRCDVLGHISQAGRLPLGHHRPHKTHTSNGIFRTMNQCRQCFSRQFISPICPQELTMAARTTTRTFRNINGKCHLIGKLLKDDICIDITKHYYLILFAKHAYAQVITFTHTTPCHLLLCERFSTLQRYKESIKQSRLYLELLIKFVRDNNFTNTLINHT